MNTKNKGDIAIAEAIRFYLRNSDEVFLPIGDKRPYDLIVDKNNKLLKVQVKYTGHKVKSGNYEVPLRVMGGNQSFHTAKKYQEGDFDLLFVCTEDGKLFEIPSDLAINKNSFTLGEKYEKYRIV